MVQARHIIGKHEQRLILLRGHSNITGLERNANRLSSGLRPRSIPQLHEEFSAFTPKLVIKNQRLINDYRAIRLCPFDCFREIRSMSARDYRAINERYGPSDVSGLQQASLAALNAI